MSNESENLKVLNAAYSFNLTLRDIDHFYRVVTWLNTHVGRGSEYWTMEGRVLRLLKAGSPVTKRVYIFKEVNFIDDGSALFLSLI